MRRFVLGWKVLGYEKRYSAKIVNYADELCDPVSSWAGGRCYDRDARHDESGETEGQCTEDATGPACRMRSSTFWGIPLVAYTVGERGTLTMGVSHR
jgi:hypothetical protein